MEGCFVDEGGEKKCGVDGTRYGAAGHFPPRRYTEPEPSRPEVEALSRRTEPAIMVPPEESTRSRLPGLACFCNHVGLFPARVFLLFASLLPGHADKSVR
jgi:hypothetical protein